MTCEGYCPRERNRRIGLLLAAHPSDVTGIGFRAGYESPSQFSSEYCRQFGAPPSQDALRLRDAMPVMASALV